MHQVRSCDFCGEDAVGVFESMPPELDPSEDEQRRYALCASCRDELQGLLEPFIARIQEDGAGDDHDWPSHGIGDGSRVSSSRPSGSQSRESPSPRPTRSTSPSRSRGNAGRRREQSQSERETEADEGESPADESRDAETREQQPADAVRDVEESGSGRESDVTVAEYVAEREGSEERERDGDAQSGGRAQSSGGSGGRPKGYRKVVRLLSNRDGTMSRGDLRALAMNAYALDKDEFETAVDAALTAGDLEEAGDGLRAP